jgi:hypothetical protein
MPKPVRELLEALGAEGADDDLMLDAGAFELESLFGGSITGVAKAKLFSEEAFGFAEPDELAALNVFWAPHLEDRKQLLAAVRDAHDRLKRRIEDDGEVLAGLGFRPKLEPPAARCFGIGSISGHAVDVSLGGSGELWLEAIDGERVPDEHREIVKEAARASEDAIHSAVDDRVTKLLQSGEVQLPSGPVRAATGFDDDDEDYDDEVEGFEDQLETAHMSSGDGSAGTEILSAGDDELSAQDRAALAAALEEEDLLDDSEEGDAVSDEEVDAAVEARPPATHGVGGAVAEDLFAEMDELAGKPRPPKPAPDTIPPANLPEEQLHTIGEERAEEDSGDTGEDPEAELRASAEAGEVMPSPDEATVLRPMAASDDDDDDDSDYGPSLEDLEAEEGVDNPGQLDMSHALAGDDPADEPHSVEEEEDEPTVARAPQGPPPGMDLDDSSVEEHGATMQESREFGASARDDSSDEQSSESGEQAADASSEEAREASSEEASASGEAAAEEDDDVDPEHEALLAGLEDVVGPGAMIEDDLEADPTDPTLPLVGKASARAPPQGAFLDDADESSEEYEIEEVPGFKDTPRPPAVETAGDEEDDYGQTEQDWEAPSADADGPPPADDRFAALAEIVGDGISSGKTGAVELNAEAFAMLREAAGAAAESAPNGEDAGDEADALDKEADELEARARELRARAELLRLRARERGSERGERSLAKKLEAQRASLEGQAVEDEPAPTDPTPEPEMPREPEAEAPQPEAAPAAEPAATEGEDGEDGEFDAFSDGVNLADLQALLDAEEQKPLPGEESYAETQMAEMDLGDLADAPSGGDVFGRGESEAESLAKESTGRNPSIRSSVDNLPSAASADVEALASMDAAAFEDTALAAGLADAPSSGESRTAFVPPAELEKAAPAGTRTGVALVVSDARARARLRKHLETSLSDVREVAKASEAAERTDLDELAAIVLVRPPADEKTVSILETLLGTPQRPPVLVVSSDPVFDAMAGVDLRVALGRRASEVAQSVIDGLEQLGVPSAG